MESRLGSSHSSKLKVAPALCIAKLMGSRQLARRPHARRQMIDAFREAAIAADRRRWLLAFSLAIVLAYLVPWVALLGIVGPKDFDQFLAFHEQQYWNAALFGLAKQWSPLMCGGLSLAGEPQVPFMSLSMLLGYLIGPLAALDTAIALYFIAGWAGAYLYAGLWLQDPGRGALAASLYIGNGFFICRYAYGHMDFIPFLALPMMLWTLHRSIDWMSHALAPRWLRAWQMLLASLLLGAGTSVVIDGSPVAIIHLMFWVGLYALVLAAVARCAAPVVLLGAALVLSALLDAGYLWPMLSAQADFPRRTVDSFTNPLALLWFLLLPVHGKLIVPATGNGHELSVFIGPMLAWLIWRYRHRLLTSLPLQMKWPLLIVGAVCIWLGMGSLAPLHVPRWLSPFDLLRPLPGFRSLLVTGRFWGFLALPLSLLGAAALWRFVAVHPRPEKLRVWMLALLAFQLSFQLITIFAQWLPGHRYPAVEFRRSFAGGAEDITYVVKQRRLQGSLMTPTTAVQDCYDQDDFIRADVAPGSQLVQSVVATGAPARPAAATSHAASLSDAAFVNPTAGTRDVDPALVSATFLSWDRIRVTSHGAIPMTSATPPHAAAASASASASASATTAPGATTNQAALRIVLNQAWHPNWHSTACQVAETDRGNLALDCSLASLAHGPVELEFYDALSARGAQLSRISWICWACALGLALLVRAIRSGAVDNTRA